jgi:hypothetical protein
MAGRAGSLKGLHDADTARQLAALNDAHTPWVDRTAEGSSLMSRYRTLLATLGTLAIMGYAKLPLQLLIVNRKNI